MNQSALTDEDELFLLALALENATELHLRNHVEARAVVEVAA